MENDEHTAAIMSAGMKLLSDHLGPIEAEIFIANVARNEFDYTKWREEQWNDLTLEEVMGRAATATAGYVPPEGVVVV